VDLSLCNFLVASQQNFHGYADFFTVAGFSVVLGTVSWIFGNGLFNSILDLFGAFHRNWWVSSESEVFMDLGRFIGQVGLLKDLGGLFHRIQNGLQNKSFWILDGLSGFWMVFHLDRWFFSILDQ